jgi:cytidyltransferase-like protein
MCKLGYISGVFDNLHQGHIDLLTKANKYCDYLYGSSNSDNYIRNKKNREPYDNEEVRKQKLLDTRLVDHVEIRYEVSPLKEIMSLRPDFIFTGDDYKEEDVVGYEECKQWGGKVIILSRIGITTTQILKDKKII